MSTGRARHLNNLFFDTLKGKRVSNGKLFLEALCNQTPVITTISSLMASSHGLQALLLALSSDTSLSFLNGPLTTFIEYIKDPDLQSVCAGAVVRQILAKLLEAPSTWKSFVQAAKDQTLDERALSAFAWLLIQLLSLPDEEAIVYLTEAQDPVIQKALLSSSDVVKIQGQQIVQIANTLAASLSKADNSTEQCPGGRHDNDFPDFKKISIYPTQDELAIMKTVDAYLPKASDTQQRAQQPDGFARHIDGQFRLLREDMLCELREEFTALAQPRKRYNPLEIENMSLAGAYCNNRCSWSLVFACYLQQFKNKSPEERLKFVEDNPKFLKHGLLISLFIQNEFVAFGTLVRDEELLVKSYLCIEIYTKEVEKVLVQLKGAGSRIRLVQIDTAIFSYEPVLEQLKRTRVLSLAPEIVSWQAGTSIPPPEYSMSSVLLDLLDDLSFDHSTDLRSRLHLMQPTRLDKAQAECFRAALKQRVVLMQGPPGTGKSFIGSLVGKAIHQCSNEKMLVVCYTHHALDDFVEHLLDLGIPDKDIVRLGSFEKATARTKDLALNLIKYAVKFPRDMFKMYVSRKDDASVAASILEGAFRDFVSFKSHDKQILLDFLLVHDYLFYKAFLVPKNKDSMKWLGENGEELDQCYLVNRWVQGKDAGIFNKQMLEVHHSVWCLPLEKRDEKCQQWYDQMIEERLEKVCKAGKKYNLKVKDVQAVCLEKELLVMRDKRIIACTTTAAAKYSEAIRCLSPRVVLVEEAGEILESHVLTALGPETKHLILIGDHKQLRPKVNYELSVEKGTGYDLNRSLFERLILKGFPYQTLFSQHRMRPEISALVRQMTYPELQDAMETQGRPDLLGFTDNIIFVDHKEPESALSVPGELGDSNATSSKQNIFEAKMTLKCVRYLRQQGYNPDDIVVLTPYLGQLRLLHKELKSDNDLVLNDRDFHDLTRAGLTPETTDKVSKPRLRISTIDNFQGEEAKVVVASLTRSNPSNDIGFMAEPERLNVLISRARDAIILIGNAENFMGSRKGGDLWKKFIGLLKTGNHMYDGFPVRCERHSERKAILKKLEDFNIECPDGGCKALCYKMMNCGIHKCPKHCHQPDDHSNIKCEVVVLVECENGHVNHQKCHTSNVCAKCNIEKASEEPKSKAGISKQKHQNLLGMDEIDLEIQELLAARKKTAGQRTFAPG